VSAGRVVRAFVFWLLVILIPVVIYRLSGS